MKVEKLTAKVSALEKKLGIQDEEEEVQQLMSDSELEDVEVMDVNYTPEIIVEHSHQPQLADLLTYAEQRGAMKTFGPTLPSFAIQLMVNSLVPGITIPAFIEAIKSFFGLWTDKPTPCARYFQGVRDSLPYLSDEQARQ